MNEHLFLAVLIYFMLGGAVFILTFILCFVLFFWLISKAIRYNLEAEVDIRNRVHGTDLPKGIPFPLWMNFIIALVAGLFAGAVSLFIP